MTMLPQQPAMFSWQQPLAALFGGLSAAGQPGGLANFGAGVNQTMQAQSQQAQQQQIAELRRMQIEQAQMEMNRANTEDAQRQATIERLRSLGGAGGATPVRPVGNYGAATGGAPRASMFGGNPQAAMIYGGMLDAGDVEGALKFAADFAKPEEQDAASPIGKIMADLNAGLIDRATADALIKKETYIAPAAGLGPTERQRNAQAAGLQPGTPEYQQYMLGRDDTAPGPFQGTGLDAQSYNIVLTGDPASPEYKAAYAQLAMPKVTFDPVTQKLVSVAPDMSWARPPAGAGAPSSQPQPPAGGDTMQLPGATVTSTQGTPIYNEGQGKAAGFADRMAASNDVFEQTFSAGTSPGQQVLSGIPVVGNYLISSDRQKFEQAERDFINAQLRRESGAVINPEEFVEARKQYIPQPGDSEAVLAQKKASRERALKSMQREGGPFYKPEDTNPDDPLGILD
jgi:hypothetical protein